MDFGKVLSRSWEIIRTHKVLWVFGILAACGAQRGGGGGGGTNMNFDDPGQGPDVPMWMEQWGRRIEAFFQNTPEQTLVMYGIIFVCAILLLGLLVWVISVYGRNALIKGVYNAEAGRSFTFSSLSRESSSVLGKALGMNFLLGLVPLAVGLVFAVFGLGLGAATLGVGLLCLVPFICLLVPLGFAYSVYIEMANVALVGDGLGIQDSLSKAWDTLRNNIGNLAIMGLILIVGGLLASFVLAIPIFLVALPAIYGMVQGNEQVLNNSLIISGICLVIAIPVMILLGGMLQAYLQSAWTLTYRQLNGGVKKATTAKPLAPRAGTRSTSPRATLTTRSSKK
jgi:hypothetical protein